MTEFFFGVVADLKLKTASVNCRKREEQMQRITR